LPVEEIKRADQIKFMMTFRAISIFYTGPE
jgi:hypothetical protein